MIGHVSPEAARGGPLAALEDGGMVEINVELAELVARLARWQPPAPRYATGVLAKYAALVSSASDGAITRPAG
jgi:dihydroxy-acid dehydratase